MVQAAQKGIPEGRVFSNNEERLNAVGSDVLQAMLEQKNWQGLPIHSPYAMRQLSEIGRSMNARGGGAEDDMWEQDLQVAGYYSQEGDVQETQETLEELEELGEELLSIDDGVDGGIEESESNSIGISEEVPGVIQWTMDVEAIDADDDTDDDHVEDDVEDSPHRTTHTTTTTTNEKIDIDNEQMLLIATSWVSSVDPATGITYYDNAANGLCQLEPPLWVIEFDPLTGTPIL